MTKRMAFKTRLFSVGISIEIDLYFNVYQSNWYSVVYWGREPRPNPPRCKQKQKKNRMLEIR